MFKEQLIKSGVADPVTTTDAATTSSMNNLCFFCLRMQKEEDINELGKFTKRGIESNWSRYDNEGEISCVASAGETKADEEPSAVAAGEDESRAHQEDLRFKQLVQSASEGGNVCWGVCGVCMLVCVCWCVWCVYVGVCGVCMLVCVWCVCGVCMLVCVWCVCGVRM